METGQSNTFNPEETKNANGDNVKQILLGQRVIESDKGELEMASDNTTR
jgi:hypothetical protein